MFSDLESLVRTAAEAIRPPERLTVSTAAEKYRHLRNPGSYSGPWLNRTTPYLVEPMDTLSSGKKGMVFCGSSQAGKTDMFLNWMGYTAKCDPSDLMLIEASQERANDFSKRRIDRLHRHSPAIGALLLPLKSDDTLKNKRYTTGAMVTISWPSITQLSGRPIPRIFLTDYDRMPMDVDGEGAPFDLAQARTTSFGRHGMTVAESSPSYPVIDPNWVPSTPHEAPPCEGILSLYNRGDRRRWHWICVHHNCRLSFEPAFALLKWVTYEDPMKSAESAWMECPHCGAAYRHESGKLPGKYEMNTNGFWLKDGQTMRRDGTFSGEPFRSEIASFWLQGVAAAFKDWRDIVWKWLVANQEYLLTGSETSLKTTTNTDQSMPYMPKSHETDRAPEALRSRSFDFGYHVVPAQVRFLVAAVDVQKVRFVVQVLGVSVGGDLWVIDRFDIRYSSREDPSKEGQFHRIRPFTYREDWRVLMREVILRTYPLADGSGRRMAIKGTICDSGGMEQAASNSYNFWRWLKDGPADEDLDKDDWPDWIPGLHARFQIYRGQSQYVSDRLRMTYPDSGRRSRFAGARGEIPVLQVNVTPVKNQLDSMLDRENVGTGRVNFASWLDLNFYKELCVETKDLKGIWQNPRGFRNESWDLFVMAISLLLERRHVGIERFDWDEPPTWAREWDDNDLVFMPEPDDEAKVEPFTTSRRELGALRNLARTLG